MIIDIQVKIRNKNNTILAGLLMNLPQEEENLQSIGAYTVTTEQLNDLIEHLQDMQKLINQPGGQHTLYITERHKEKGQPS